MSQITQADIVRRIVNAHIIKPDGYNYGITAKIGIPQEAAARVCALMLKAGTVVRVKVKGHRTRLHDTAEASQAWAARHTQPSRENQQTPRERATEHRALMLELSRRPGGIMASECPKNVSKITWHRHAHVLERAGLMFIDSVIKPFRYFATDAEAEASRQVRRLELVAVRQDALKRKRTKQKAREALHGKERIRPYRVAQKLAKAARPPKQPKPEKFARCKVQAIERKPYSPPAPRRDAVSVDGPNVKRSYRPWVDLRAVTVPFVQIGQPGWAMSVGGAA